MPSDVTDYLLGLCTVPVPGCTGDDQRRPPNLDDQISKFTSSFDDACTLVGHLKDF